MGKDELNQLIESTPNLAKYGYWMNGYGFGSDRSKTTIEFFNQGPLPADPDDNATRENAEKCVEAFKKVLGDKVLDYTICYDEEIRR